MTGECWECGEGLTLAPGARLGSRETCSRCGADLHCCKNCEFHDPAKHNQCTEPQSDWVQNKEAANYCDFFRMALPGRVAAPHDTQASGARQKFDSLFKL